MKVVKENKMSDTVASDQSTRSQKQKGARSKGKENRRTQPDFQLEVGHCFHYICAILKAYFVI